jgi:hypothetical protein
LFPVEKKEVREDVRIGGKGDLFLGWWREEDGGKGDLFLGLWRGEDGGKGDLFLGLWREEDGESCSEKGKSFSNRRTKTLSPNQTLFF